MPCAVLIFLKIEDELNHYERKYPSLFKNFISSLEKKKDKMKEKGASFVTISEKFYSSFYKSCLSWKTKITADVMKFPL